MKKTFLYILAVMTIGAGCRKTYNDTIQGQTPDQRISAALTAYQKKLTSAPYGWIFLESTTGIAYNQGVSTTGPQIVLAYYMQFTDSGRVTMLSDFDPSMAATPKISSYSVKELTRPALIFDTYSYLHVPCDPDPNVSHSPFGFGYGWGTDFEFSFSDSVAATALGDTVSFIGNLNSAQGKLIKATQAQQTAYLAGKLLPLLNGISDLNSIQQYFKRLSLGGVSYDIRIDPLDRTVTFTWVDGSGNLKTATVLFYATGAGITFTTPIVNGSQTITGIDNITWDAGTSTATLSSGSLSGSVTGLSTPVKADLTAPTRWWNYGAQNAHYWASWTGFHANGTDDAYGVTQLSDISGTFYQYSYWPNYFGGGADLFIPLSVLNNTLGYGYAGSFAADPLFVSSGGRAIFQNGGDAGPVPPGGPVAKSNTTLYNNAGFYFVQTGPTSYDMILATDAKTWISWFWPQ